MSPPDATTPSQATPTITVLLVSPDLMVTSRLAGLARDVPARIETLRSLDKPEGPPDVGPRHCRLAIIDLGAIDGDPAVIIARVRQIVDGGSGTVVAAFGPHVARQRLDDARSAGADHVVSRGELLGGFASLVRRWCHVGG
jgi:hypothetical protein